MALLSGLELQYSYQVVPCQTMVVTACCWTATCIIMLSHHAMVCCAMAWPGSASLALPQTAVTPVLRQQTVALWASKLAVPATFEAVCCLGWCCRPPAA